MSQRPLRLLFVLGSPEYLRYYDSTMRLLSERGHTVRVAVNALGEKKEARLDLVDAPRIEIAGVVPERSGFWSPLARAGRGTVDFIRYLHPDFSHAASLRARMKRKVLPWFLQWLDHLPTLSPPAVARAVGVLKAIERAVPVSAEVRAFVAAERPDVVVVSPLIDAASEQVDIVRASQAAGVPVVAAIASWDNLTNKGHMRVVPDLVTVWNDEQRREAAQYHGVAGERVITTGAQPFDRWFDRGPSQERAAFCAMVGLPDTRPFALFTGSSVFIARSEIEVPFARRWLEALRASGDPLLRDLAVLVRPHPFNADAWIDADLSDLGPVAVWPRKRYTPADESVRTSFFDSLFHSAAVVGINTSAMIEAAILRKPVLSVLTPEFAGTQEGTLHFHYLLPENGGFLQVASSLDEHVAQLGQSLHAPVAAGDRTEQFVRRFIRPHGLSEAATPRLAAAFEAAADKPAEASVAHSWALSVLLAAVAALVVGFDYIGGLLVGRLRFRTGLQPLARRLAYETRFHVLRNARLLRKRVIERPARQLRIAGRFARQRPAELTERAWKQLRWTFTPRGREVISRSLQRQRHEARRSLIRGGRLLRQAVRWPAVRALRVVRLARYVIATRLLGRSMPGGDPNESSRSL